MFDAALVWMRFAAVDLSNDYEDWVRAARLLREEGERVRVPPFSLDAFNALPGGVLTGPPHLPDEILLPPPDN